MDQQAQLHPIPAACARLSISRSYLYGLMNSGDITFVKAGRRRLIPESAITAYIQQLTEAPGAA